MYLIAIYLPKEYSKKEIENIFSIDLKKGIETAYYGEKDGFFITFTQFNVISIIGDSKEEVVKKLKLLNIGNEFENLYLYQDYPIEIDNSLSNIFKINNEKIELCEKSTLNFSVISLVISQSVGLEKYEKELEARFLQSREIIESIGTHSIFERSKLIKFVKELTLMRHDMVTVLLLLDKPNILWDNEDEEKLYNSLASILELKDRFEVIEYKLTQIKDDITMIMDLINHKQGEFLEWVIIILILIEIIMGLIEWFAPNLIH